MDITSGGNALPLTYTSDNALKPFQAATFDPAEFLNATLPAWNTPTRPSSNVSLAEISNQTQTLLSQLNAQLTRSSSTLTQLTDDILRSGGRLAYEVEVLRGDASALTDVLTDGLHEDIQKLLPANPEAPPSNNTNGDTEESGPQPQATPNALHDSQKPDYITRLQTLALVRTRLETVIKTFGDAIDWVLQPSETASQSSIIGFASPESANDAHVREAKGREFAERIRNEIVDLVEDIPTQDQEEALKTADLRVEALRDLALVWKGTVEEKPRMKFVESLTKIVQDKRR